MNVLVECFVPLPVSASNTSLVQYSTHAYVHGTCIYTYIYIYVGLYCVNSDYLFSEAAINITFISRLHFHHTICRASFGGGGGGVWEDVCVGGEGGGICP